MHNYGAIPRGAYKQQPRQQPRSLGFERYRLSFDDTLLQYGDCGNGASLDIIDAISVEVMLKPDALAFIPADWYTIVGKWKTAGGERCYWMAIEGGAAPKMRFGISKDGAASSWVLKKIPLGIYTHAVGTFDSANINLYFNAELVSGPLALAFPINSQPLNHCWVAASGDVPDRFSKVDIAFIRIYKDYVLTTQDMAWNRLNYSNPVRWDKLAMWLTMEEGAGLIAHDMSGNGNDTDLLPALPPPTWKPVKQWELRAKV